MIAEIRSPSHEKFLVEGGAPEIPHLPSTLPYSVPPLLCHTPTAYSCPSIEEVSRARSPPRWSRQPSPRRCASLRGEPGDLRQRPPEWLAGLELGGPQPRAVHDLPDRSCSNLLGARLRQWGLAGDLLPQQPEIGRASCRER